MQQKRVNEHLINAAPLLREHQGRYLLTGARWTPVREHWRRYLLTEIE